MVEGIPSSRDRITFEVDVDARLLCPCQQLSMSHERSRVRAKLWLIGRNLPCGRVIIEELVGPGNEIFPVWRIGMARVMLPPSQLTIEKSGINRGHLCRVIVVS